MPYYYAVDLATTGIRAEFTATRTAAYYRFTFPQSRHAHLVLSALKDADIEVVGSHTVQGSARVGGTVSQIRNETGTTREYFYAEFSRPYGEGLTWQGKTISSQTKQVGDEIGFVSDVVTRAGEQEIEARIGISYISVEQAKRKPGARDSGMGRLNR